MGAGGLLDFLAYAASAIALLALGYLIAPIFYKARDYPRPTADFDPYLVAVLRGEEMRDRRQTGGGSSERKANGPAYWVMHRTHDGGDV